MMTINPRSLQRWRANPILFVKEVHIDPETDKPFVLLPAEREFLKHAFRTGDDGRLLYPELIYACPKSQARLRSPPSSRSRWSCCTAVATARRSVVPMTMSNRLAASFR